MAVVAESVGYRERYSVYASRFECKERTIKLWVKTGKEGMDPCPLDEAGKMVAWWGRRMKNRCPEGILKAQAQASDGAELMELPMTPVAAVPEVKDVAPVNLAGMLDQEAIEGSAIEYLLMCAKRQVQLLQGQWEKAVKDADEGKLTLLQRQMNAASETLRRVQRDATAEAEKQGNLVPKVWAEAAIGERMRQVVTRFRAAGEDFVRRSGWVWGPEISEAWESVVDEVLVLVREEVLSDYKSGS